MQSLRRRQAAAKEAASKAKPSATFGALVGHGRRVVLGFSETGKTRGANHGIPWQNPNSNGVNRIFFH
jgi:hypothetical protein